MDCDSKHFVQTSQTNLQLLECSLACLLRKVAFSKLLWQPLKSQTKALSGLFVAVMEAVAVAALTTVVVVVAEAVVASEVEVVG